MVEPSEPAPQTDYDAAGGVEATGSRLDGAMHGTWEWFRRDGTVVRTGHFDRGRQIGTWRTFERSGRLVKETVFRDPA